VLKLSLDIIYSYKMRIRSGSKTKNTPRTEIVLDTSAVIDGRVLSLAEAGFMNGATFIVTNIILDELQYLADEGDSFKRARARYGFEVLSKLMKLRDIKLRNETLPGSKLEVDQQLLNLAKKKKAQLFTVDFNLAQRATIEGAQVLNPAELANALKPQILPGENFTIKLIQKGDDKGQAVGYLPDGTMVVAEKSGNKIGQTVELKSSKIIQTAGGRIVFAQAVEQSKSSLKTPQKQTKTQGRSRGVSAEAKNQSQRNQSNSQKGQKRSRPNSKEDSLIDAINKSV
jgi:uncharacterized protein YacL